MFYSREWKLKSNLRVTLRILEVMWGIPLGCANFVSCVSIAKFLAVLSER